MPHGPFESQTSYDEFCNELNDVGQSQDSARPAGDARRSEYPMLSARCRRLVPVRSVNFGELRRVELLADTDNRDTRRIALVRARVAPRCRQSVFRGLLCLFVAKEQSSAAGHVARDAVVRGHPFRYHDGFPCGLERRPRGWLALWITTCSFGWESGVRRTSLFASGPRIRARRFRLLPNDLPAEESSSPLSPW
jgi:hypothetical protein